MRKLELPSGSLMVRIMSGGYKVTSASWANTFPKAKHEVRANPSYERLAFGHEAIWSDKATRRSGGLTQLEGVLMQYPLCPKNERPQIVVGEGLKRIRHTIGLCSP